MQSVPEYLTPGWVRLDHVLTQKGGPAMHARSAIFGIRPQRALHRMLHEQKWPAP
jgi:hypothetical protein